MPQLINASNLHRYYADTHAVNDLSIDLQQGDILGLLGPNGAGKSSCMQMLSGTLAPSAGEIIINGFDLLEQPNEARRHIGYLPDKPPLYEELTVDEYLDYAARLRRIPKSEIHSLREQAKQRCGLGEFSRRLISNLSKGYQQRVGIAQAIIHQPKVIILDEPTVGLDPIQMQEIRKLICELGKQHGIILSTHILPEVQAVCNRVQIIYQGKSVFNSDMDQLQKNSQIRLRLKHPPELQNLQNIDSVSSVTEIEPGHYLLDGEDILQHTSEISQLCVENGWQLSEISPQRNTLEQLFMQFTSGEQGLAEGAADDF